MNSLPPKNQAATLSAVNLLTVIAPVHNNEGRITVRVEELLDILTDARIPFEFLLLDFYRQEKKCPIAGNLLLHIL